MTESDSDLDELQRRCERFLHWQGRQDAATLLATIPPDTELDRYGAGGVVTALEREVAELLGKPAAVFLPSGTMAQQITLRVHADRRGNGTVAMHPRAHPLIGEADATARVQRLTSRTVGERTRLLTIEDLRAIPERIGVLLLELPQREIGGQQPAWQQVEEQVAWAHEQGGAAHLDGARLWESAAGYGCAPAAVAEPFDTVYVSFYKALGALPGCCVAGQADVMAEVREWRTRMGGTLFGLWPNAASAQTCLRERLPRMPAYLDHARAIADALRDVPGVRIVPDPPQVSMMHLLLTTTESAFLANVRALAIEQGIWTWRKPQATDDPRVQRCELAVGDATCQWTPEEVRDIVTALLR